MRRIKLAFFVCLLLIAIRCSDSAEQEDSQQFYIKEIAQDASFQQYLSKFSELLALEKRKEINLDDFKSDFSDINSEVDFYNKIEKYFSSPDLVISTIKEMGSLSEKFREANKDFLALPQQKQEVVITSSIQNLNFSNEKLKNYDSKVAPGGGDQCSEQMASDKNSCFQTALAEGVLCGLLSPTLILAGICYAAVMTQDVICHTQAENDYAICKKYSVTPS